MSGILPAVGRHATAVPRTFLTAGIDVGTSAVKTAIFLHDDGRPRLVASDLNRIRRRDLRKVIHESWSRALALAAVAAGDVDYVASTGEGDLVDFRVGHFYGMTTHARGAQFLFPRARSVVDVGALHARCIRIDDRARVVQYKMTGQCASGTGQFVENIARYLGVTLDEVGPLSLGAVRAESVSGICAVLAETDVINMVSRGVATSEILRGIHESVANRLVKLLRTIGSESPLAVTGGLGRDEGLVEAIRRRFADDKKQMEVLVSPEAIFAGAFGAALWGAHRFLRLAAGHAAPPPSAPPAPRAALN